MHKKMRMGLGLLMLVLLCGCAAQPTAEPPVLLEPVSVAADTAAAYIGDICRMSCYPAAVTAHTEGVYFETEGSIAAVYAYPGKQVEEGEILIELDQTALTERAQTLREEVEHTERTAAYEDAISELEIERLKVELRQMQANYADAMQIALKQNEIASAQAALRQAQQLRRPELDYKKSELEKIERQLGKNVLRAPFSGCIVSMQNLSAGERIKAYEEILFLADDCRLSLSGEFVADNAFDGAERMYARIAEAEYDIEVQPVEVKGQVKQSLAGAKLMRRYRFSQGADISGVQAGEYALICVVHDLVQDALLLPAGAVQHDADGWYVEAEENGECVRRAVSVGVTNDALVQIMDGIEEGAVVYVRN